MSRLRKPFIALIIALFVFASFVLATNYYLNQNISLVNEQLLSLYRPALKSTRECLKYPLLCPDYIKIDQTLTTNLTKHYNVIKKSIISMADEIGSDVIAEGVETEKEYSNLCSLGINLFQGYYFAKPGEKYPKTIIQEEMINAQNRT